MASPLPQIPLTSIFLITAIAAVLISPALSLNCTSLTNFSQTLNNNTTTSFTNCTALPSLNATLQWSYNPTAKPDPTLTISFTSPPARPEGWIGWGLNPTGSGMIGAQALIAFKNANGSMVLKTYNVSSYNRSIEESKISYKILNSKAEYLYSDDGVMGIFATLALPVGIEKVNQVWQVGALVKNDVPEGHSLSAENLSSKNVLDLAFGMAAAAESGGRGGGDDERQYYQKRVMLIWIWIFFVIIFFSFLILVRVFCDHFVTVIR